MQEEVLDIDIDVEASPPQEEAPESSLSSSQSSSPKPKMKGEEPEPEPENTDDYLDWDEEDEKVIQSKGKEERRNVPDDDYITLEQLEEDPSFNFLQVYFDKEGWDLEDDEIQIFVDAGGGVEGYQAVMDHIYNEVSKPQYASDEVALLNEWIESGGTVEEFYQQVIPPDTPDYENLDMEDLGTQKWLVYQYHKTMNPHLSEKKLMRLVEDSEEEGTLEEEAYAYQEEFIQAEQESRQQILQEKQNEQRRIYEEQQRAIHQTVNYIRSATPEQLGVDLTKAQREKLIEFGFSRDPRTGLTPYEQKLQKDPSINLRIMAAVFTGLTEGKVPAKAKADATKKLMESLNKNPIERKRQPDGISRGKASYEDFDPSLL